MKMNFYYFSEHHHIQLQEKKRKSLSKFGGTVSVRVSVTTSDTCSDGSMKFSCRVI